MERTFTQPLRGLLRLLLLQVALAFGIISVGYSQATLPIIGYGGTWDHNLPQGWSGNLGPDFVENLGSSTAKGSAGFDFGADDFGAGNHNLVIHFDKAPGELTYWLAIQYAPTFEGNNFSVFESADGVTYTLVKSHTQIPLYDAVAKGVQSAVTLNRASRYVKFSFEVNNNSASVLLDDINLGAAVDGPEINIRQGSSGISTGGAFAFGTVGVNTSNSKTFVVENSGTAALLLSGTPKVVVSGTDASSFIVNETATSGSVAAGDFTTFDINFRPITFGTKTATISIANNDADENPYVFTLTGTAQEIQPTVASISPDRGKIGEKVTITGTYLTSVTSVTFGGVAAVFTIINDTQIEATVPQNAKTGPIRVTTSGGRYAESTTFTVTSPFITGISPASGTVDDVVIVSGANFARPSATFTGANGTQVSASIVFNSSTELRLKVPLNAITGPIYVTSSGETVQSNVFTVTGPSVTALDPTEGKIGYLVKITGKGFDASSTVSFNGVSVPAGDIIFTNSTEITAKVPVSATTGPITVTTAGRSGQSQVFTVLNPAITVTGTLAQFKTKVGTPSASQNYQVSAVNLEGNLTVAAPANFEVSLNNFNFSSSVSLTPVNGAVAATPVYVRYNPAVSGLHNGNVSNTSVNAVTQTVAVAGNSEPATITLTGTLAPFSAVSGTTSASQSYTVSGVNLESDITVTAPAHYEVSLNNSTFASSVTVVRTGDAASQLVYVRYKPTAAGTHNGNILHTAVGATTREMAVTATAAEPLAITSLSPTSAKVGTTVQISGYRLNQGGIPTVVFGGGVTAAVTSVTATTVNVTVPAGAQTGVISLTTTEGTVTSGTFTVLQPALTLTGTLEVFNTEVNKASAHQTYTISGANLNGGVTVTAPSQFEVSLTSAENGYGSSVQVPLTNAATGSLAATTIYVRFLPSVEGAHTGNITHASAGTATQTLAVQGGAIPPQAPLPVELVSFTYVQQQDGVLLEWKTASEKDNSHFEVELAYDLKKGFERIGRVNSKVVNSATLTNYQYKHNFTAGGTRYYRLKQVDLDGTFEYSNVIAVDVTAAQAAETVTVAPNPINYNSKVFYNALSEGNAAVRVHSLDGKLLYTKEAAVRKGENEIQLPVYDLLAKGVYLLTVELNGAVHKVKVLKQ